MLELTKRPALLRERLLATPPGRRKSSTKGSRATWPPFRAFSRRTSL